MKYSKLVLAAMAAMGLAAAHAAVDTVQYNTGYFVDKDVNKYSSPYYRRYGQDWGWQHGAIGGSFGSASLNISAFDVDAPSEVDNIYAMDSGTWTLLGSLKGANDTWAFTTFNLGASFFDDIKTGLQVKVEISRGVGQDGWLVTLAKSTLTTDGSTLPSPVPGVPEPETYAMLLAGLGVMGAVARRRKAAKAA